MRMRNLSFALKKHSLRGVEQLIYSLANQDLMRKLKRRLKVDYW